MSRSPGSNTGLSGCSAYLMNSASCPTFRLSFGSLGLFLLLAAFAGFVAPLAFASFGAVPAAFAAGFLSVFVAIAVYLVTAVVAVTETLRIASPHRVLD